MRLATLTTVVLLMLPFASHAISTQDAIREYRAEAKAAHERGKQEEALKWLGKAVKETEGVKDAYTRGNLRRYIAQEYATYGDKEQSRALFGEALEAALAATPWYRKQSGVIGVLELEQAVGDTEYARLHAIKAIESGLLEEVDAGGKSGETGRFYKNLKKTLSHDDVGRILARVVDWKSEDVRKKTLYSLNELALAEDTPEGGWSGKLQPKSLEEPHPKAGPFEQLMWRCLVARIYLKSGNKEASDRQMLLADGLLRMMNKDRDKAKVIFERTKAKLEEGK